MRVHLISDPVSARTSGPNDLAEMAEYHAEIAALVAARARSGVNPPWTTELRGTLDEHVLVSDALRGNPLGDPHERPLWVYTPPGYDASGRRYPSVYVIQGYTGQLDMWRNRAAFRPTFLELLDELFGSDARRRLRRRLDVRRRLASSSTRPAAAATTPTSATRSCRSSTSATTRRPAHRGISGKSSGGYGAIVTPMLRPDLFGGFASHAGGGLFEVSIRPFFRVAARALRDGYEGSIERFWERLPRAPAARATDRRTILLQWASPPRTRPTRTARSGCPTTPRPPR